MFNAIVNPVILVNVVKMVRRSFLPSASSAHICFQNTSIVKAMVDLRTFCIVNRVDTSNVFIMVNVRRIESLLRLPPYHRFARLDDLSLPNGILFSRSCPTGLWFSALNDRCDYPSVVQC